MRTLLSRPAVVAAGSSMVVSLIWMVLAWRSPTSTFHFAPLIACAVGPYVAKPRVGGTSVGRAAGIPAAGLAVVGSAVGVLVAADLLRGPTFWSADGAWLEAALFAVVGSVVGAGYLSFSSSVAQA